MLKRGFTLFEVLLVLGLMSCIIYLSCSVILLSSSSALTHEVDRLSSALLSLQRKALLDRQTYKLMFVQSKNSYTTDVPHALIPGISYGILPGVKGPPSRPTCALKQAITWPDNTIYCYPDGTISAGAVYLTDGKALAALTCDASAICHVRRYVFKGRWEQR
jgi:prepilin-type N-terminal cleavage/methylation domain-containing protein